MEQSAPEDPFEAISIRAPKTEKEDMAQVTQ